MSRLATGRKSEQKALENIQQEIIVISKFTFFQNMESPIGSSCTNFIRSDCSAWIDVSTHHHQVVVS